MKILQDFYKTTVSTNWATGTGNRYVTTLPTPTSGWLVVSPNNTTLREIVAYSAVGTDGGGNYVTLSARGVGGTTDQTHIVNEPVRMNITAGYWADIYTNPTFTGAVTVPTPSNGTDAVTKDYADGLAIAGSPDSSTSVKGIGRVSVAPASPTTPIFVGDNDPRVPTTDENDALVGTSGTPSTSNKYVTNDDTSNTAVIGKVARFNGSGLIDGVPLVTDIQTFTTDGTWNKPTGAKSVKIIVIGAGGGGGSGATNTGGQANSGAGGGGGAVQIGFFKADDLDATEAIVVGTGGAGGNAVLTDNTNGNVGTAGGLSSFGTRLKAGGGGGGGAANSGSATQSQGGGGGGGFASAVGATGGVPTSATAGIGSQGISAGAAGATGLCSEYGGASGGGSGTTVAGGSSIYAGGGGGGGGVYGGTTTTDGGAGGTVQSYTAGGGGAGGVAGANGTAGSANSVLKKGYGGAGGGGGGHRGTGGGSAGNGGAGGFPAGGGGGGGGAHSAGIDAGAGGAGAGGRVIVITYF